MQYDLRVSGSIGLNKIDCIRLNKGASTIYCSGISDPGQGICKRVVLIRVYGTVGEERGVAYMLWLG